jgi:hypothetical protein
MWGRAEFKGGTNKGVGTMARHGIVKQSRVALILREYSEGVL